MAEVDSRATHWENFEVRSFGIALQESETSLHVVSAAKAMTGPRAAGLISLRDCRKRVLDRAAMYPRIHAQAVGASRLCGA